MTRDDEGLLIVMQEDHGHHTGELAAALQDAPVPKAAFVAAARTHDNGWRESDAAPMLDPKTGLPHTYRSVPDREYLDVWARGIDRAAALDARVGLLVSLHGARFFGRRKSEAARAFAEARRREQETLLAALGHVADTDLLPRDVALASEWLYALDAMSLFFCGEWKDRLDVEAGGRTYGLRQLDAERMSVAPFPFDGPRRFRVPARRLAAGRFDDEGTLRAAFDSAPRFELTREIVPG